MAMVRPEGDNSRGKLQPIRMTENESNAWKKEAERLSKAMGKTDGRGMLSKMAKALFKQHMELPARERNKLSKFFD